MLNNDKEKIEENTLYETKMDKNIQIYGMRSMIIYMLTFVFFLLTLNYSNNRYMKINIEDIADKIKNVIEEEKNVSDEINKKIDMSINNKYSYEYINENIYLILRNYILKSENIKTMYVMFLDRSLFSIDKSGKFYLEKDSELYVQIEKMLMDEKDFVSVDEWIYESSKDEYYKLYSVKIKDSENNVIGVIAYSSVLNEPHTLIKQFENLYQGIEISIMDSKDNQIYCSEHNENLKIENVNISEIKETDRNVNVNENLNNNAENDNNVSDNENRKLEELKEFKLDLKKPYQSNIKNFLIDMEDAMNNKTKAEETPKHIVLKGTNNGMKVKIIYDEVLFEGIKIDLGLLIALFSITILLIYWFFVLFKNDSITKNALKIIYSVSIVATVFLLLWSINEKYNNSRMKEALIEGIYINSKKFDENMSSMYVKQKIQEQFFKDNENYFEIEFSNDNIQNKVFRDLNIKIYDSEIKEDEAEIDKIKLKIKNKESMQEIDVDEEKNLIKYKRYFSQKYLNKEFFIAISGNLDVESFDAGNIYWDDDKTMKILISDKIIQLLDGKISVLDCEKNAVKRRVNYNNININEYDRLKFELEIFDPLMQASYIIDYSRELKTYLRYVILVIISSTMISVVLIVGSVDKLMFFKKDSLNEEKEVKNDNYGKTNNSDLNKNNDEKEYEDIKIIASDKVFANFTEEKITEDKMDDIQFSLSENTYRSLRYKNEEIVNENANKSTYDYISKKYMRANNDINNKERKESIFDVDEAKIFKKYADAIGVERYDDSDLSDAEKKQESKSNDKENTTKIEIVDDEI